MLYTVLLTTPVVAGKLAEQYSLSHSQVGLLFSADLGVLILAVFPTLYADSRVSAIYWTLAGLTAACVPVVAKIDGGALQASLTTADMNRPKAPSTSLFIGLAAMLLVYVALSGVWSFMAQTSEVTGIDLSATSTILAAAPGVGIASVLLATILGDSPWGRSSVAF